jgi:hypothetical protein
MQVSAIPKAWVEGIMSPVLYRSLMHLQAGLKSGAPLPIIPERRRSGYSFDGALWTTPRLSMVPQNKRYDKAGIYIFWAHIPYNSLIIDSDRLVLGGIDFVRVPRNSREWRTIQLVVRRLDSP